MDGQPHKLAELAEYLQTSPRLVRYEMSEAGAFLEKEGLGPDGTPAKSAK